MSRLSSFLVVRGSLAVIPVWAGSLAIGVLPVAQAAGATPTAFVANRGANTVTPINVASGEAGTPIVVGSTPTAIALTPSGTTAYVVDHNGNTVTPISVGTDTAATPIRVGSGPWAIAITPEANRSSACS